MAKSGNGGRAHTQHVESAGEHHIKITCTCGKFDEKIRGNVAFPADLRKAQAAAEKHHRKKHK